MDIEKYKTSIQEIITLTECSFISDFKTSHTILKDDALVSVRMGDKDYQFSKTLDYYSNYEVYHFSTEAYNLLLKYTIATKNKTLRRAGYLEILNHVELRIKKSELILNELKCYEMMIMSISKEGENMTYNQNISCCLYYVISEILQELEKFWKKIICFDDLNKHSSYVLKDRVSYHKEFYQVRSEKIIKNISPVNPYPDIFKDNKSYSFYLKLDTYFDCNHSNVSFIYRRMKDDKFIHRTASESYFRSIYESRNNLSLEKLKTLNNCTTSDKEKAYTKILSEINT